MNERVFEAPGSFRDPQGQVFECDARIFRALYSPLAPFPRTWTHDGPLADLVAAGKLWPAEPLSREEVPTRVLAAAPTAVGFLEHPRIATISFPYEWPFALLKRAALLHLELHRSLLTRGFTLADGYAYNVQFVGTRPTFIDSLAIVPHVEGHAWAGYTQFCESFLNPLLLAARGCETWQDIYRGRIRGIPARETARQLGVWGALRAGAYIHVILNSQLEGRTSETSKSMPGSPPSANRKRRITRAGLDLLLRSLERCIRPLTLPKPTRANWGRYECDNSYSAAEREGKRQAVGEFVARTRPGLVLDIGCNAGQYSEVALASGADAAVGLERDVYALDRAVVRADTLAKPFLPLQADIQNPSPSQGWDLEERRSLCDRLKPDAVLCLALVHHLVLTEALPLDRVVRGIVGLAPTGLIEFVPHEDPMAAKIAGSSERMSHCYDLATFLSLLSRNATIVRQTPLSGSGRVLIEFRRGADSR